VGQWEVRNIPVKSNVTGFAFYAEKDKAMADNADYGFMIWNGKSKGTLNNIINLSRQLKVVLVYFTSAIYAHLSAVLTVNNSNKHITTPISA
jgi:hypothetical protein